MYPLKSIGGCSFTAVILICLHLITIVYLSPWVCSSMAVPLSSLLMVSGAIALPLPPALWAKKLWCMLDLNLVRGLESWVSDADTSRPGQASNIPGSLIIPVSIDHPLWPSIWLWMVCSTELVLNIEVLAEFVELCSEFWSSIGSKKSQESKLHEHILSASCRCFLQCSGTPSPWPTQTRSSNLWLLNISCPLVAQNLHAAS